jgi:hypothetical protein
MPAHDGVILSRAVREGLMGKGTFDQRPAEGSNGPCGIRFLWLPEKSTTGSMSQLPITVTKCLR